MVGLQKAPIFAPSSQFYVLQNKIDVWKHFNL